MYAELGIQTMSYSAATLGRPTRNLNLTRQEPTIYAQVSEKRIKQNHFKILLLCLILRSIWHTITRALCRMASLVQGYI